MSLPILNVTAAPTPTTLIRYFHQTQSKWTEHMAQPTQLEFGTAWANPDLSRVYMANRMMDVALVGGITPQQALAQVEQHYTEARSTCWQWVMNPSAPPEQTSPMVEHLRSCGFTAQTHDIMYLERIPGSLIAGHHEPVQIIPARASFKHARELNEQAAAGWNEPQLADAAMMHLDEPHYDALLSIKEGRGVAYIGVLAMGEVGLIEEVFVAPPFRKQGFGTTMMSRAIEICARSLFKHILLGVRPDNAPAVRLYEKFGFRKIGEFVEYRKRG